MAKKKKNRTPEASTDVEAIVNSETAQEPVEEPQTETEANAEPKPVTETVTESSHKAPFAVVEAYKSIRTNLMFMLGNNNVLVVSSPNAGEGKSTTAINVAIAFSQMGDRVLLIDGDLRCPSDHKKLHLKNERGLSDCLAGFCTVDDAVQHVNKSLDILTAGQLAPNPSELLGSAQFASLVENASRRYAYVLIDTPPINVVSDALIIAPHAMGILMVLRDGITSRESVSHALAAVKLANVKVLGTVMNDVNARGGRSRYYSKYYSKKSYYSRYGYYRYGRYGYGRYGYGNYGKNNSGE